MKEKKGVNKGVLVIAAAAVIVVAVMAGVIVYLVQSMQSMQQNVQETEEVPRNVIVREDNVDEVIKQMEKVQEEEKVAPGAYEVYMNMEWVFENGASVSENAFVENSTANTNMVYFIITVNGDEEVYHSAYMEVGSRLDEIKLDKELEKGEYNAVITYHLVDDDFKDLSQVSMSMKIIVEN